MNPIELTHAAVEHIQQMLSKNPGGIGFRLSIKKTGCSGYAYVPEIINEAVENDIYFIAQSGLPVYLDQKSIQFLEGLTIDYVEDTGNGLKQKQLVYINPNEKNRCGCGESFTT